MSDHGTHDAAVDDQVAAWMRLIGRRISSRRIARWREDGLLPVPLARRPRPPSAPHGRTAPVYDEDQRPEVERTVVVLADNSGSGRRKDGLALVLFAHERPVTFDLVITAIYRERARLRQAVEDAAASAKVKFPPPEDPSLRQSDAFETAEALALDLVQTSIGSQIRQGLRRSGRPATADDAQSVLHRLVSATLDRPVPAHDTFTGAFVDPDAETVDADILYAFGTQGLIEAPGAGIEAVVPQGPSAVHASVQEIAGLAMSDLPDDVSEAELRKVRDFSVALAAALRVIPPPLRHHLGGPTVAEFWNPSDPAKVAHLLTAWTLLARGNPAVLDASPIIDAVRAQGWLKD